MRSDVTLRRLDEQLLRRLLAAAVAQAEPGEVMPPVPGPDRWTAERRTAFRQFHRSRSLAAEPVETTYAVVMGEAVVGAARLCPLEGGNAGRVGAVEAGVWIGRAHRGSGVGGAVLGQLLSLARAAGFDTLFISTRPENTAVLRLLAARGIAASREGETVTAWVDLNATES